MSTNYDQVADLLIRARKKGISVVRREEKLKIRAGKNAAIDPEIIDEIKKYKAEILYFLKEDTAVATNGQQKEEHIPQVERSAAQRIPLSYSQERLWLIDRLEGSVHYHVARVLRLKGQLDKEILEKALLSLVERHEVLRTAIKEEEGQAWQQIMPAGDWRLAYSEINEKKEPEALRAIIEDEVSQPFNLADAYNCAVIW